MGHARHGKDSVCELLEEYGGMSFTSSSLFCAEHIVMPVLEEKYGYTSVEECFKDRVNHRGEWFNLIEQYCKDNGMDALAKAIYRDNDIYCGIRNHKEYFAAKEANLFDLTIWVDASKRLPPESNETCSVNPYMADIILDNNGDEDDLVDNVFAMMRSVDYIKEQKKLYRECALRWMESKDDRS